LILVTGGLGYIGSNFCSELICLGKNFCIVDDLSNSSITVLQNLEKLAKKEINFLQESLSCIDSVKEFALKNNVGQIVHFAGFKSANLSINYPYSYYQNNFINTVLLVNMALECGIKSFVFSSSATVYGNTSNFPINENNICSPLNPYGRSKYFSELFLSDISAANPDKIKIVILRYFNPIGSDKSFIFGDNPKSAENIMPILCKVGCQQSKKLEIFGNDYPTHDGTAIRDYIHVTDLASGHIAALDFLTRTSSHYETFNLGTGKGYSVFDLIDAFQKANNIKIPFEIGPRRPGDIPISYADNKKAKDKLSWFPKYGLEEMCASAFQSYLRTATNA